MIDLQCIGGCIAGIGQTIGREGPAYRCIAGGSQGAEGAGSACNGGAGNSAAVDVSALGIQAGAGNGFTRNISCRNDSMGIDVAGCSQISILEGSYTVCQFISGDGAAGVDVAIGDGSNPIGQGLARYRSVAHGSTLTIGYCFTGDGCLGSDISIFIYGEGPVGPFDFAISTHSCLGFAVGIAAGVDTIFIHHRAVCTNFDTLFVQGNLVVLALVQDHFIGIGFGGSHVALGINGSGVLLQYIVIAQAQSAVDGFHQFGIGCFTGCGFVVDIGLELLICFFQISHRIFALTCFFINGRL